MKQQADKGRREEVFSVGDWVYLKLQPYRQHSILKRPYQKLASKFFGPYQIIERVGNVAYRLQLPVEAKIYPVFHVALLKRRLGDHGVVQPTLPPYADDGLPLLQPAAVLGERWVQSASGRVREVLIRWTTLPKEDATWEPISTIKEQFPNFNLEDKVILIGGANDTNMEGVTASRRRSTRTSKPNIKLADYVA
ncbi:hypothetical protein Patl1_14741 [Pistacia atlantica]|uniref:Uncharacterized protein n=1 Tax=Pistacia atlantica TaxID=434234 RepID=A0ACC1AWW6_9ROSI|nr:hypothetical protein Patl1_14741 [Pistacia atlantica]